MQLSLHWDNSVVQILPDQCHGIPSIGPQQMTPLRVPTPASYSSFAFTPGRNVVYT